MAMSNKALCLPQLDKLEAMYRAEHGKTDRNSATYIEGCLNSIEDFRLMLEGIDMVIVNRKILQRLNEQRSLNKNGKSRK